MLMFMCFINIHIMLRKTPVTSKIQHLVVQRATYPVIVSCSLTCFKTVDFVRLTLTTGGQCGTTLPPPACRPYVGDKQRLGILNRMSWKACMFDLRSEVFGLRYLISAKVSVSH